MSALDAGRYSYAGYERRCPCSLRSYWSQTQMAGDIDDPVILGGFPQSGLNIYIGRLVRVGHSVAIALQDEEKEPHIRETVRIVQE